MTDDLIVKWYRERGMNWIWCYEGETLLDPVP
jgi:hypothetical protein